jgi:hypothetical protein
MVTTEMTEYYPAGLSFLTQHSTSGVINVRMVQVRDLNQLRQSRQRRHNEPPTISRQFAQSRKKSVGKRHSQFGYHLTKSG